jgi:AraC-like DNA-binding protein
MSQPCRRWQHTTARRSVDREKGTSLRQLAVIVTYRELAPAPELRGHVRAYFSFTPGAASWRGRRTVLREVRFARGESFCSPVFADGHTSLVVELGATCRLGEGWTVGTPVCARVMGALRTVGDVAGSERPAMVGVYLEPGSTSALLRVPAVELTDRIEKLEQVWGPQGERLAEDLVELDEVARVERLEATLLARLRRAPAPRLRVDVVGLARWARAEPTGMTVRRLADAAGVSRRHLTRVFRDVVGVSPKRYCRLARFQAGLTYAGAGAGVKWAQVAAGLGYADQSHMIAEFRELSSLTPEALATQRWFHPFILEAGSRLTRSDPLKPRC